MIVSGRKTATVTITTDGRDKGKVFLLTEMAASRAEKWAERALLLALQAGADVQNVRAGMRGVAIMGVQALLMLKFDDLDPLLDDLMKCVQFQPDPNNPAVVRPIVDNGTAGEDIEEVETRINLKMEVLSLHLGFSLAGELSKWKSASPATT